MTTFRGLGVPHQSAAMYLSPVGHLENKYLFSGNWREEIPEAKPAGYMEAWGPSRIRPAGWRVMCLWQDAANSNTQPSTGQGGGFKESQGGEEPLEEEEKPEEEPKDARAHGRSCQGLRLLLFVLHSTGLLPDSIPFTVWRSWTLLGTARGQGTRFLSATRLPLAISYGNF